MSKTSGRRRWTAAIAGALCAAALATGVLLTLSAGGSTGGYTVRAIFDDAANIIPGEDVKIDGVKVGAVGSVTPTPRQKAAVVLNIENPGFHDFRSDASCTIEPEALIGEKFVNCLPTQPRAENTPPPPPLRQISAGREGEGQYLLPVTNTSSPVDVDQLQDINRLPVEQRLTIILNELGAGLAGRGSDINVVVRRADPALRELDKLLAILANQNKLLTNLAEESDRALAPIPGVKSQITSWLAASDKVAKATANQRAALAQNFADFPAFLEQLGPAMERLGRFADQTTPTFANLKAAAPGINQMFTNLAPFARSSTTFFKSLGSTAKVSGPALVSLQPLLAKLKTLGASAKPFSVSLAELFTSLRDTGGLERFMDFIFLGAGSTNGYDALGHFLRTEGVANLCLTYAITPSGGCSGKLFATNGLSATASSASASASAASANATLGGSSTRALARAAQAAGTSLLMARTLAVLKGATAEQAIAKYPGSTTTGEAPAGGSATSQSAPNIQPVGGSSSGTTYYSPSAESNGAGGMLLNYLLGE